MACKKCNGNGSYSYDYNHGKPCEDCCPHDQGTWLLEEHYGDNNSKYCCKAGCGTVWDSKHMTCTALKPCGDIDCKTCGVYSRK